MKFTALRLSGFKSFVDSTELALMPGLTGVVGPNGCGKSNLLEALRWVMGESRAKSMRGEGMEDVIFAGTDTRPARNFAEVSLMLEETAGNAPTPFDTQETLEVARRIVRDAGSVFRINGKEMRARDVRVLFADAATGPQSPSLVRQGQIGLLIAAKPQGRRKILEDAAGIAGLYERRKEVEQRLRAAEENLLRVDDVLVRLDAQVAGLKRQARQAERYAALTDTIRESSGILLWLRYSQARDDAMRAAAAVEAAARAVAEAAARDTEATDERQAAEEALPSLREEATIAMAVHQRLLARRDALAAESARAAETLARLQRDHDRMIDDLGRESELSIDARTTIDALESERAELSRVVVDAGSIALAAKAVADAQAAVTRVEAERDALAAAAAAGTAELKAAERIRDDAVRALDDARRRLATTEARANAETQGIDEVMGMVSAARTAAQAAVAAHEGGPEKQAEAEAIRRNLEDAGHDARATYATAQGALAALEDELTRLEKNLAVPGEVNGILHEIRATPGYERALVATLEDAALSPVTEYAPDMKGWREFGALGVTPDGEPLARHVTAPPALVRILATTAVIPRHMGTAAQERLHPGQRLVSTEGDLWRWDGYFRGGDATEHDDGTLRLQRLNRRETLSHELNEARETLIAAKTARDDLDQRLTVARKAETTVRETLRRNQDAISGTARKLADIEADHARRTASLARLSEERETLHATVIVAETRMAEAAESAEAVADPADLTMRAEAARAALVRNRATLSDTRSHHAGIAEAQERRTRRIAAVETQLDGWRKRARAAERHRADISERLQKTEAELAAAQGLPDKLARDNTGLDSEVAAAEARLTKSSEMLIAAEDALRRSVVSNSETSKALSTAREGVARNEALAEGAAARANEAAKDMRDEIGEGPDTARERFSELTETDPTVVEGRLLRARADRERLGAVNLRAKVEIDEASKERDTLGTEKLDLEGAIAKLRSGLGALNREGRERLLAAFALVNGHFRDLFSHLFGGGQAELHLTESDDPLEAGLEILCQPPGKRVQALSLLSGGEQTLAAMALIFAVFLVNPAPVCVLDEVDAPLDDANVERFCTLLDEMTRRSDARFLVITHHALTMSRMDRLYGVTMVERGVSKLVSVDLGAAVDMVDS